MVSLLQQLLNRSLVSKYNAIQKNDAVKTDVQRNT